MVVKGSKRGDETASRDVGHIAYRRDFCLIYPHRCRLPDSLFTGLETLDPYSNLTLISYYN